MCGRLCLERHDLKDGSQYDRKHCKHQHEEQEPSQFTPAVGPLRESVQKVRHDRAFYLIAGVNVRKYTSFSRNSRSREKTPESLTSTRSVEDGQPLLRSASV